MTAQDSPLFLLGHDRSGTTLLRLILDRGDVAIPPESMFLLDFAAVRRAGGLEDPERAGKLLRAVWEHPRVRLWRLEGGPPELPPGLTHAEAYRFAVTSPFAAYASGQGKARWGDKTPAYLWHLDEPAEIWPDARFLVLVRDGRDVALSVIPLPFGPNNVWAAARSWARAVRLGRDAERRYPGRVQALRYEDLVERPHEEVPQVCEFLGIGYDPDMLAVERTDTGKVLEDQSGWFTSIWAGINTTAVGKWRRELTPRQQQVFERVAGRELAELGYETGAGRSRTAALLIPLYAVHDAAARGVNFVRLRLVRERGREVGYVVKRKLARAWR